MEAKPFSLLAGVYDDIMRDVDYEAWGEFILAVIEAEGWQGRRVLDIGCGTGNSSFPFVARGFEVIGIDASADMLAVARAKLPVASFVQADFQSFRLAKPVDLTVSIFDSLNNLLDPNDFILTAANVYQQLNPGGAFMFDVNTSQGLKNLWEDNRAEGWAGEVYYRWEHSFDPRTGLAKVVAFCSTEQQSFTETHFERPYDIDEVRGYLRQVGFHRITVMDAFGDIAEQDAERVWFCAWKA